jgi:hypothetical protein
MAVTSHQNTVNRCVNNPQKHLKDKSAKMGNGINIHSAGSLTRDTPDKPTVFIVQGRYQNCKSILPMLGLNV